MPTVSLALGDEQFAALSEYARDQCVTVDDVIRKNIDEFLKRQSAFRAVAKQVLKKNEELYLRLAK